MQNTMCDNIVSSNSQELSNASASSALKLFENPQFKIRVIMRCAEPWFVAKDVATCIEHSNVTKMCDLCRDKDKVVIGMDEIATNNLLVANMTRELTCISESGLYRILAKCNLPKCEPFESWVFDEVLPSIRKTGSYSVNQPHQQPTIYDYARALIAEKERSDALEAQNKALEAELTSEKEAHEKDNEDFKAGFDILNAQKAQIGSNREATAMATASSAKAHQRLAEKILETNASELIALRAVVEEQRSRLWDANQMAHEICKLNVLKKDYSLNTLQNKARLLLSHFATKLGKRPIPLPNGATYTDSLGRLQPSKSTYYERDVVDAVLNWVAEHPNKFALIGGKRDPLLDEW